MTLRINGNAIEIDGDGGGVVIAEIVRVTSLLVQMFGAQPRIRVTGVFGPTALGPVPGADPSISEWNLRQIHGSGYCDVIHVGSEYLHVQATSGLNNHRSIAVAPDRGQRVRIRLLHPSQK